MVIIDIHKININYVTFIYDLEEHLKLSKVERLLNIYNGPIFNSLDEVELFNHYNRDFNLV